MTTIFVSQNYGYESPYRCRCDNCGRGWSSDELAPIHDAEQRLTPGCETPAGECSECFGLVYVAQNKHKA